MGSFVLEKLRTAYTTHNWLAAVYTLEPPKDPPHVTLDELCMQSRKLLCEDVVGV
jgi:hypothetical protein